MKLLIIVFLESERH